MEKHKRSIERVAVLGGALAIASLLIEKNDNSRCMNRGTSDDIGILDIPIHDREHESTGASGGFGDIEENSRLVTDRNTMNVVKDERNDSLVRATIDIEIKDGEGDAEPSAAEEKSSLQEASLLSSEEKSSISVGEEGAEDNSLMQSSVSTEEEDDDDDDEDDDNEGSIFSREEEEEDELQNN